MTTAPELVRDLTGSFVEEVDSRLPDQLTNLFLHGSIMWGEFFAGSDINFVAVWEELPAGERLDELRAAHQLVQSRFRTRTFDGFHCTAEDLTVSPAEIAHRPVFRQGAFEDNGTLDISIVTWHELALGPVVMRGQAPTEIYTSLPELLDFTRTNLDTYWRRTIDRIKEVGVDAIGERDDEVTWIVLGAARLHHLLRERTLTSKSGAGRYIIDNLADQWSIIGLEALRIRERPDHPSLYSDHRRRGRDVYDLLVWLVEDGIKLPSPSTDERVLGT